MAESIELRARKIGVSLGTKLSKEMADGNSLATTYAIMIAAFVDFLDLIIIGQIPVIGWAIKIICVVAIQMILFNVGGFIRTKVRIILWLGTIIEIIPILDITPTYTLSMIWAHFKIKKRAREAKAKLEEMQSKARELPNE